VGLAKRLHCHALRHSFADLLRRRDFDMEEIRRALGHASLEVTGRYLDHIGSNELSERMRDVGPVLVDVGAPRNRLARMVSRMNQVDVQRLVELLSCALSPRPISADSER